MHRYVLLLAALALGVSAVEAASVQPSGTWHTLDGKPPLVVLRDLYAALPERDQYAEMELWRGLMSNHSVVVHRSDLNGDESKVRFDDERCLGYVPIRQPWTICVQERLPPGVTGALINQTHLFDDLYLFVDAQEKQIYDRIDGQRSISEIVENIEGGAERAKDFFEKLWWYDQIVFDTSKALTTPAARQQKSN